jgi:hypothetical protein
MRIGGCPAHGDVKQKRGEIGGPPDYQPSATATVAECGSTLAAIDHCFPILRVDRFAFDISAVLFDTLV